MPAQAGSAKLIYRFSKPSKSFSYRLRVRYGSEWWMSTWQTLKSVKKKGLFKGSKSMTVKKLFAGKPIKVGSYQLRLSAGRGTNTLSFRVVNAPVQASGFTHATAIAAADSDTCAVLLDGAVDCWGWNFDGQLGYIYDDSSIPVPISGITDAASASIGYEHICASLSGGTVDCWGDNGYGQLGDGETDHGYGLDGSGEDFSPTPVTVSNITNATAVSAGIFHTCALLSGGAVDCWGRNDNGQLGDGVSDHGHRADYFGHDVSATPVQVKGVTNATQVSVGGDDTCALLSNHTVECWGANGNGQLGDGTQNDSPTPVQVSGITNATAVSVGDSHTCAVLSDGTVDCWGDNGDGQLGDGVPDHDHRTDSIANDFSPTPVQVNDITTAISVSAGDYYTCALLVDGTVECWGANGSGQLGDGVPDHGNGTDFFGHDFSRAPVPVSGITNATVVGAGDFHTCALLIDRTVECWGDNEFGQLGNGMSSGSSTPVNVVGLR